MNNKEQILKHFKKTGELYIDNDCMESIIYKGFKLNFYDKNEFIVKHFIGELVLNTNVKDGGKKQFDFAPSEYTSQFNTLEELIDWIDNNIDAIVVSIINQMNDICGELGNGK